MDGWVAPEIPAVEGKTRFGDFDIPAEVLRATVDLGFEYATPIQAQALPHTLANKDVTGRAQTGTGKTAAFLIAALDRFKRDPRPDRKPGTARVMVLAPTRELALQIGKDANDLSKYMKVHNLVCFGGMDHREQRRALQTPVDILAGTPGRILDYIGSGHLDLSQTEVLVIDEADRMLDMGFIPDVRRIVARIPAPGKRQTLLFSATLDESIMRLAHRWLQDPVKVDIEPEANTTSLVEEIFYSVPDKQKLNLLLWMLENDNVERMIIFGNRKDRTMDLTRTLRHYDVQVELLSGDVPQKTRLKVLERFRDGTTQVIVATDVAARGIHVDNVSHVVNWDLPYEPEDYVHRIGRTGRAGEEGKAVSFADEYGSYVILELEEFVGRQIACVTPDDSMLQPPSKPGPSRESYDRDRPPGRRGNRGHGGHRRPRWDNKD